MRRLSLLTIILSIIISSVLTGCSQSGPTDSTKETAKQESAKPAENVVKPSLGEVTFTLPKGWMQMKQQNAGQSKESELLSFIRKIDQSLWANPGPVGTSNLPIMDITITHRRSDASRDDLNPKKLGGSLVKQGVLSGLVEADEIQVTNLPATRIVGDSPQQGRVTFVLLPRNGFLYKWTLRNTKPDDKESEAALDALLASANFK